VSLDERNATIKTICKQCTIVEGKYSRVVLSSEYVLKIANKLERDLTFQHRSSTQCVPMFFICDLNKNGDTDSYMFNVNNVFEGQIKDDIILLTYFLVSLFYHVKYLSWGLPKFPTW